MEYKEPILKSKKLEELQRESEEDLKLSLDKLDEESSRTPTLYNKYHKEYRLVKMELFCIECRMKNLYKEKWLYYTGKEKKEVYTDAPLGHKLMKNDVKIFIESDEEIQKLSFTIFNTENKLEFLKLTLEEISKRTFHIKNALEAIKVRFGII